MKTPARYSDYGLGLFRFDTACGTAFGHIGAVTGYRTAVYARSDGSRVVEVMINIDNTFVRQADLDSAAETALCFG